jgi:hypothetical protein
MIVYASDELFPELLRKLKQKINWTSPLYTSSAVKYYQQISFDNGWEARDQSFILVWEKEPVFAFVGAFLSKDENTNLLAFEVPCHVVENKGMVTSKANKSLIADFDKILKRVNGQVLFRDYLIGGNSSFFTNYLLKKDAVATPMFSKVIDLAEDEALLWRNLRKSYSSLINKGLRELSPQVINAETITWKMIQEFRRLHIQEAGRETRSEESWKRQYEMVLANEAFVVIGQLDGELVSAGLFMNNKTNCYYGVSASRRDLFEKPMFHSLLWTAVLHAKILGCKWFEVGEQLYQNHPHENPPTKKELGISDFKAGFGGETKVFLDLKLDKSIN